MRDRIIARAGEIVSQRMGAGNGGFCTLALVDENGYPAMTTISISKADGIKWITFCTSLRANSVLRARRSCKAGVCVNSEGYHIALTGTIEVITDEQVKQEMWYQGLEHNFSGPHDPDYCVLKFETERYNLLIDWKPVRGSFR
ncbi:MAG: general stress protein [Clostridiales bacterium]|nr:general stress protein [Clostridiales bacterium]